MAAFNPTSWESGCFVAGLYSPDHLVTKWFISATTTSIAFLEIGD
jgi:hypothetical protein